MDGNKSQGVPHSALDFPLEPKYNGKIKTFKSKPPKTKSCLEVFAINNILCRVFPRGERHWNIFREMKILNLCLTPSMAIYLLMVRKCVFSDKIRPRKHECYYEIFYGVTPKYKMPLNTHKIILNFPPKTQFALCAISSAHFLYAENNFSKFRGKLSGCSPFENHHSRNGK